MIPNNLKCQAPGCTGDLSDVQRAATLGVLDQLTLECNVCQQRQVFADGEAQAVDALLHPKPADSKQETDK